MPGAMARGTLAAKPIKMVVRAETRAVATKTPPGGMPQSERIAGLTNRIYDMVKKVVTPLSISREAIVRWSLRWNIFSTGSSGLEIINTLAI